MSQGFVIILSLCDHLSYIKFRLKFLRILRIFIYICRFGVEQTEVLALPGTYKSYVSIRSMCVSVRQCMCMRDEYACAFVGM